MTTLIGLIIALILIGFIFHLNRKDLQALGYEKNLFISKRKAYQLFLDPLTLYCENAIEINNDTQMIKCKRGNNVKYVAWHVCRDCVKSNFVKPMEVSDDRNR